MYRELDHCLIELLIEVTTMGELSLGWRKGGHSHLIEGGRQIGGHLIEVQL